MKNTGSMHGDKLKLFRTLRGFGQDYMADALEITQAKYSRIENNQTKLDTELLQKAAQTLGISVADIISTEPIIIQNIASNKGAQGHIEHFHADQKEIYENHIASLKAEVEHLKKQNEGLMKLLERK